MIKYAWKNKEARRATVLSQGQRLDACRGAEWRQRADT